ncbi:MAG: 3'(2'),5'-bisphosphate nucleotidase CysQ, partial [Verrucomicrobiales bacterium]
MESDIDIDGLGRIARRAGAEILEVYGRDFEVETKEDQSPLTEADRRSNEVIVGALREGYPDIPFISEETRAVGYEERRHWERFWLIDPLDGTKEFVKRNGEFTVNIALIERGVPVAGVVYQPVGDRLYYAVEGNGSFLVEEGGDPLRLSAGAHYRDRDKVLVVASRSHLTPEVEAFVEELRAGGKKVEFLSAGSSLKLCLVAEGRAAVYPRLGPTMEWDTGAAHAVVIEAGKEVLDFVTRRPLVYNKENLLNPFF